VKPVLHIYPAFGPGFGTPRVYTVTVEAHEFIEDAVARLARNAGLVPLSRDHVFSTVFYPSVRDRYADIRVHSDILHPSL
jgi:hypothetical protein